MSFIKNNLSKNIARVILGIFILYAGVGHLTFRRLEFQAQVPPWLPLDADLVVILSGIVEIAFGLSLILISKYRIQTGIALAIFFILIFPGNISQYVNGIDAFGLDTDKARLIRLFFQPVLIFLALWSTGTINFWRNQKNN